MSRETDGSVSSSHATTASSPPLAVIGATAATTTTPNSNSADSDFVAASEKKDVFNGSSPEKDDAKKVQQSMMEDDVQQACTEKNQSLSMESTRPLDAPMIQVADSNPNLKPSESEMECDESNRTPSPVVSSIQDHLLDMMERETVRQLELAWEAQRTLALMAANQTQVKDTKNNGSTT